MTKSVSDKMSFTSAPKVSGEGVGLYQWQVYSHDLKSWVQTANLVCRSGSLANTQPNCPYNACDQTYDNQCSVCENGWSSNGVEEFLQ